MDYAVVYDHFNAVLYMYSIGTTLRVEVKG